jgi:nucleoside-diphosphate-sugar epimerase
MEGIIHAGSATSKFWKTHTTDVEGTRRLLEIAREAGV